MTDDFGSLFDLLDDMTGTLPPEAMLGLLRACIDDLEQGNDRFGEMPSGHGLGMVTMH